MKPSLCFISFAAYPLFNKKSACVHGGAEVEVYNLATHLSERGYKVSVIVGDFGQKSIEHYKKVQIIKGTKIGHSSLLKGIWNTAKLLKLCHKINADVYITKGAGFLTAQIAFFCRLFGKKFIFKSSHHHNIDLSLRDKNYHYFYRWALRQARPVVLQNQEDVKLLRKNYNVEGEVIRNHQAIPKLKDTKGFFHRKGVLWVGRLVGIKQPEVFLEFAQKFPNEKCTMIAFEVDKVIVQSIKKCAKLLKNVELISNLSHHKIEIFYRQARLLMNTSEEEGFPNTFIEAMKWGMPIVSLKVDPDEIIQREGIGIVGEQKKSQFFKSVVHLLNDEIQWNKASQKAYCYARKEFGKNVIKKWEKLLKTI